LSNVTRCEFWQLSNATLLRRIEDMPTSPTSRGTPYAIADVSSIDCTVSVNGEQTWSATLAPSDVMLDALQGWPKDAIGYNFRHTIPPSALPTAPGIATVLYVVTLADGYVFSFEFIGRVRPQ
jgi:hypothetical protein